MANQMISIVTPCYNEEGNVERCASEIASVMAAELPGYRYEHIFCDNSSTDRTLEILRSLASADRRIKVIANSRNVGPFRNIANGLRHVSGDLVIPMVPADLQDPPAAIPKLVGAMRDDVDVVYGVRSNRRENPVLRFARAAYYGLIRRTGGQAPPRNAGEFLLARRSVIDSIVSVGGSYPYVRGLVAQTDPRYAVVPYEWGQRVSGRSKNSLPDLVDQALNGLVSTARAPIRAALLIGVLAAILGVGIGLWNLVYFFTTDSTNAGAGIPTLIVAAFLFGGTQLFFLGLAGEYVISIHTELRPAPPMFERERINFEPTGRASDVSAGADRLNRAKHPTVALRGASRSQVRATRRLRR
ncbi:glycosyltransferase family 2 protein [Isoptericola sp. b441]|uniref:Glycosyltransferase family 2 protein n=1 Tax=Actinotalea lenta TaxID=3064654 RepID=A0ABT9DC96_9CELL|nr:glycosyltransferase family 2 protein [Isoptericola sp. b441]MDO8108499.1 glycosyltransferase family 2 protein [Isoptericola sp. b441]